MNRLNDCRRLDHVNGVTVQDMKTRMSLEISAGTPVAAYLLDDDDIWPSGVRPDAVLISDGLVCFIELKGRVDPDDARHAFDQVRAGVRHFAAGEEHGAHHHRLWSEGNDLPVATRGRRNVSVNLAADHSVRGVIFTSRGGARVPPQLCLVGGRAVWLFVIQEHGKYGRSALSLDRLLDQLVLPEGGDSGRHPG